MALCTLGHPNGFHILLLITFAGLIALQFLLTSVYKNADYAALFSFEPVPEDQFRMMLLQASFCNRLRATNSSVQLNGTQTRNASIEDCPIVPNNLVGNTRPNLKLLSIEEQEKLFTGLELGGWYKPKYCKARHKVAIIVPYRDRLKFLQVFLLNLHPFLQHQQLEYAIYIIEQMGNQPFNRAKLLNVGFKESLKFHPDWTCFIFHDVDLIPENDYNLYVCSTQPRHMSVAVSSLFYSNNFWGWGGEDDDMSQRIRLQNYHIARYPSNVARYYMLKHAAAGANPKRFCIFAIPKGLCTK